MFSAGFTKRRLAKPRVLAPSIYLKSPNSTVYYLYVDANEEFQTVEMAGFEAAYPGKALDSIYFLDASQSTEAGDVSVHVSNDGEIICKNDADYDISGNSSNFDIFYVRSATAQNNDAALGDIHLREMKVNSDLELQIITNV